ncbi:MAG: alpha/beta hydrolase [Myxococcota bacterium]|nr:alpha/beta hydrolase [Myxococcota bacterium]
MKVAKIAVAVSVILLLGAAGFVGYGLRDAPGRDAIGTPGRAQSGAAEITFYTNGPVQGVSVVLIPSYSRPASDFNELVVALNSAGMRTIAVQPRGIGASTLPFRDVTYHTFANDVIAVLDAVGVTAPVHVIGHAYGNRVARTVASDHPDRVGRLVLLAAGGARPTPPETSASITKALFRWASEEERRQAVHHAFFAKGSDVPESWMRGWHPLAGIAQARAMAQTPLAEWTAGGRAPILVLEPAEDAAAAGGGELLREAHPERVRVVMVEGAGHALLPERPEFVAREVIRFLVGSS